MHCTLGRMLLTHSQSPHSLPWDLDSEDAIKKEVQGVKKCKASKGAASVDRSNVIYYFTYPAETVDIIVAMLWRTEGMGDAR